MTYGEIVAALERSSANTDTDPRWLAATILRDIPLGARLKIDVHDQLLAAAKEAVTLVDGRVFTEEKMRLQAMIAAAEELE